ncbi:MAG: diguanylate cyclase [Marinilabiliales bacterium]|nr:MAG: diguanylate cyclase [Marinilabiliales bacterium]
MNLESKYLGLNLRNPVIIGSSSLTSETENIKKLYKAGAGAIVLKSVFEEQILMEIDSQRLNNMYGSYDYTENYVGFYTKKHNLDNYLNLIEDSKKNIDIPVIASINCVSPGEWISFAQKIESAGADALELNMFIMPSDISKSGSEIEEDYLQIAKEIKSITKLPVAMKLNRYFSGMAHFMHQLSKTGIDGLVLFNRFFSPDIDLHSGKINSSHLYSLPEENAEVLRWLGILSGKLNCDLAASTGIHDGKTALKNITAGAKAIQIASVLYKSGINTIGEILKGIEEELKSMGLESIEKSQGLYNQDSILKPTLYERAQFMKYYSDHK